MQQQPTTDKVDGSSAYGKHQLAKKYQLNKADVLVFDAHVHNGLCEERQNKL